MNGNICLGPFFCDLAIDELYLALNSPCSNPPEPFCEFMGALPAECPAVPVPVDPLTSLPTTVLLRSTAPNPFMGSTQITYEVPPMEGGAVSLVVFNAAGRRVRTLVSALVDPGVHHTSWDGLDEGGQTVASGVYYLRLAVGSEQTTRPVLRLR